MLDESRHGQAYMHVEHGEALERAGRFDEAMLEFKRAVEADPGLARAHLALGYHYQRKCLLTKAAEEFRTALALEDSYEAYYSLGHVLIDLEQYEEAVRVFARCLEILPEDPSSRYELAYAYYCLADYQAALTLLKELLTAYPDDWDLHHLTGSCYLSMGDYTAAVQALETAVAKAPSATEAMSVQDTLAMARRHLEMDADHDSRPKDRLYADYGVIYLGSGADDGIIIPEYEGYNFRYHDVAVTLRRLYAVALGFGWHFDTVTTTDEGSQPLGLVLSRLFHAPLKPVEGLSPAQFTLVVTAHGSVPELCQVVMERIEGPVLSFILGVDWAAKSDLLPDIVGVLSRGPMTLPWDPAPSRREAATIAGKISRAYNALGPEPTLPTQVSYYTDLHRRLRFLSEA